MRLHQRVSRREPTHGSCRVFFPRPPRPGGAFSPTAARGVLFVKVINETEDADGCLKLLLYGNPTRPGYCRIIGRQVRRGRKPEVEN